MILPLSVSLTKNRSFNRQDPCDRHAYEGRDSNPAIKPVEHDPTNECVNNQNGNSSGWGLIQVIFKNPNLKPVIASESDFQDWIKFCIYNPDLRIGLAPSYLCEDPGKS